MFYITLHGLTHIDVADEQRYLLSYRLATLHYIRLVISVRRVSSTIFSVTGR